MNESNSLHSTKSTALVKSESLLSAEEIEDATVTPEIVRRYREKFQELTAKALIETIEADFIAEGSNDGLPPFWSGENDNHSFLELPECGEPCDEFEGEECPECEKPLCECKCDQFEQASRLREHFEEVKERRESNVGTWHDGCTRFYGQSFQPVFEPGEADRDEEREAYLGGHSFLDHGITQLIRATSWATDVPEPFCALLALNTFSTACGKGLQVSFKPGEITSLGIYALVFARSGTGKSKASGALSGPFLDLHTERRKEWELQIKPRLDVKKKALTGKLNKLQKLFEKEESDELLEQMVKAQADLDQIDRELNAPTIYLEDTTVERLVELLPLSGEQMTYYSSDAGAAIQNVLGKYNKDSRPDDHVLLKSYSLEPFSQARITRDDVSLEAPCGNLLWMTQPDKWEHLSKNEWLREGGFLPRCLLAEFECEPKDDDGTEKSVPKPLTDYYNEKFRAIFNAYRLPIEKGETPKIIKVSKLAAELMRKFHNEVAEYRRKNNEIDAFAARWVENAKRIAGVLHAAYFGDKAHERELHWVMVHYAIKVIRFFMERQKKLLQSHVEETVTDAAEKFNKLWHANGGCITMREITNRLRMPESRIMEWVENSKTFECRNHDGTVTKEKKLKITSVRNPNGTFTTYVHYSRISDPKQHMKEIAERGLVKPSRPYAGR
jgi:Protein of unknown function (DUF3987)